MSQENVEIVRRVYAAWNRGDRETALGFAHHEVVIDASRRVFNPTTYVGKEGAQRLFADTDEVWERSTRNWMNSLTPMNASSSSGG